MQPTVVRREKRVFEALDKLYEFEREPVSPDKLQPARHFAALLAGEHVASTEFVIGALFVKWGASVSDVFFGLIIGNLMAVLTWTFICTPVAIRTRLTLYWYLRKIAGPATTTIYNVLNAVLFCILAGCMITVSASSLRLLFGIPAQTKWYPEDIRFVILVLVLGAVVVTLAILGFKKLSQFAEICAPWMFFMFVAGAIVLLPALAKENGWTGIHSFADFWAIGKKFIWTGRAADPANQVSFWHVAAFAWICNLAMHGGLSDMALFRYAKTTWCGLTSAVGMFFGHYVAWICAGVMGAATAYLLNKPMVDLDPGDVATMALGISGAICVVLAGWTTSNPTLYRAGLAFQAVTPNWPRWLVTLGVGIATTIIACSPFVFNYLLNFVGWYGLLLMPVGAIVFAEHWLFPLIGLNQFWVSRKGLDWSWPALASWFIGIGLSIVLVYFNILHLFFLFVPIWLLTILLYIILSRIAGAGEHLPELPPTAPAVRPDRATATGEEEHAAPNRPLLWISGGIALLTLLFCMLSPFYVLLKGAAAYEQRLATYKTILMWVSIIHLATATVWAVAKEKSKGGF